MGTRRPSATVGAPALARSPPSPAPSPLTGSNAHHNAVFLRNVPHFAPDSLLGTLLSGCAPISISRYQLPGNTSSDVKTTVVIVFASPAQALQAARQLDGNSIFGPIIAATTGHVSASPVSLPLAATHSAHPSTFAPTSQPSPFLPTDNGHTRSKSTLPVRGQPGLLPKKNLYVCNIPPDMVETELEQVFGSFGAVNHVCILSTPDAAGRRRAFVDMLSGGAAKIAAAHLNNKIVRGFQVDISFAHIQRTTGGELTALSSPPSSSPTTGPNTVSFFGQGPASLRSSASSTISAPPPPYAPRLSRTLIIKNLTPSTAIDTRDLYALFRPFGFVANAQLVRPGNERGDGWGQVAFGDAQEAETARQALDGRLVDGHIVAVERMDDQWLVPNARPAVNLRSRTETGTSNSTNETSDIAPSDSASCVGNNDTTPASSSQHPSPFTTQHTPAIVHQVANAALQQPTSTGASPWPYTMRPTATLMRVPSGGQRPSAVPLPAPSGDGAWPTIPLRHEDSFEEIALTTHPSQSNGGGGAGGEGSRPDTSGLDAIFRPNAYIRRENDLANVDARLGRLALAST